MKGFLGSLNPVQRATMVWLLLLLATVGAALMSLFWESGIALLLVSLFILMIKGQLIVDHFMDLRHVARHWRLLMSAYCIVISGFILLAFVLALH